MKTASITEAKNNLSALIDSVKGGASVLILDRGRPVARLEPVSGATATGDERLARLVREGVVRPGGGVVPEAIFKEPPPRLHGKSSVVQLLLEERREGR
jgi:prevent-host-death family protein